MRIDHYEMMSIVPMSYTSEELKPIVDRIKALITESKGKITREENLGKLKFAYTIDNMSHGHYVLFEFDMPTNEVDNINKGLKIMKEVMRTILVTKELKTSEQIAQEKAMQAKFAEKNKDQIKLMEESKEIGRARTEMPTGEEPQQVQQPMHKPSKPGKTKKEKESEKITLDDLDKKLDTILEGKDMI